MKKMILALAVAMATMAAATQCYATPITIAFEGQVSDISGTPHDFGANVGDAVSGTLTFNPTTDLPFASGTDSSIFQSPAAFTFSTGASGSGAGAITTGQTVFFGAVVSSNFGAAVGMTQFDPVAGLDYIASYLSIAITTTDQIPVASSLSSLSLASYLANAGTLTGALWFNTGALDMPSYRGALNWPWFEIHLAPGFKRHQRPDRKCSRNGRDQAGDTVLIPDPASLKVGQLQGAAIAIFQ